MATKKKGLFSRLIEGPERSEDYARRTLPSNRWSLGLSLATTNFSKLIKINLLMVLFISPLLLAFIFREILIGNQSYLAPFSQNLGIGYPMHPFLGGREQEIVLYTDILIAIIMFALSFVASIGLSGGFYVMRNMVWTEGVFVSSDFWSGVKKNYKWVCLTTAFFTFVFAVTFISIDLANYQLALNMAYGTAFKISKIVCFIFLVFACCVYFLMLTMGVTYKLKFWQNLSNAVILAFGLLPLNAFFLALASIPFLLFFAEVSSIIFAMGLLFAVFLSLSLFTLIWTNYSHWVFDEFINDRVAGAKKYRGIYKKGVDIEPEKFVYKKTTMTAKPVKPITDYDVEIAILPESYSRADLLKLEESKKLMMEDSDRYAEEHKNDYADVESEVDDFMNEDVEKSKKQKKSKKDNKSKK